MASLEVDVVGVPFDNEDADGGLRITRFGGWNDGPSADGDSGDRPNAHGAFDSPVWRGPRFIPMAGWVCEPDPALMLALRNQFMGILADGSRGQMTVTEFGVTTWANVRLYGTPTFEILDAGYADWTIQFRAADMRRYGVEHEEGPDTSVDVSHDGNFPALSTIEVTGSMPSGYTVAAGGKQYRVAQALTSGHTHRIDMATGWLYLDDVLQAGAVHEAGTWEVGPGVTLTHTLTPVSGSGLIVVKTLDTFV